MKIQEFYENLDATKYPLLSKYTKAVMFKMMTKYIVV